MAPLEDQTYSIVAVERLLIIRFGLSLFNASSSQAKLEVHLSIASVRIRPSSFEIGSTPSADL